MGEYFVDLQNLAALKIEKIENTKKLPNISANWS